MRLTSKFVLNAKPGRHGDGQGLYLLVKPSGAKSWVLRIQNSGKRRDFGLGSAITEKLDVDLAVVPLARRRLLTLAEAREKARIGRLLAKAGVDPSVEWKKRLIAVPSFETAAREYYEVVRKSWRDGKHGAQWINTLETYAFPSLGDKLVSDVTAPDIQAVLLPIWLTKSETARRVRQRISVVLDYSHGKGWRESGAPAQAVNKLLGGVRQKAKSNFHAMPWSCVPAFMDTLRAGGDSVGRLALQFLIHTGARSGEVRGMTWDEVDLAAAEWTVPGSRMKAGKMHVVPLTGSALEVLAKVRRPPNAQSLVFRGLKEGKLSDATLAKALRVNGGGKATVHGFRSAFRDWAAEHGISDAWAEAALAHTVASLEGKTAAAYKRTTYFHQRKDSLMPAWEAFLTDTLARSTATGSASQLP